jgi:hypothetical protein
MNIGKYDEKITSELIGLLLTTDADRSATRSYFPNSITPICEDKGRIVRHEHYAGVTRRLHDIVCTTVQYACRPRRIYYALLTIAGTYHSLYIGRKFGVFK